MSAQIITLMKYGLLALMYLYFARVMHTVWVELRPTGKLRANDKSRERGRDAAAQGGRRTTGRNAAVGVAATSAAAAKGSTGEHRHQAPSKPHAPKRPPAARSGSGGGSTLVVVDPANLAGMNYPLTGRELTIGRAPGCGVTVDDSFVSSLHARLAKANDQTVIEDLGSRNGTYVNDRKISEPTVINPGDRVRVGSVIMELR